MTVDEISKGAAQGIGAGGGAQVGGAIVGVFVLVTRTAGSEKVNRATLTATHFAPHAAR
jgi:hypothetical protein